MLGFSSFFCLLSVFFPLLVQKRIICLTLKAVKFLVLFPEEAEVEFGSIANPLKIFNVLEKHDERNHSEESGSDRILGHPNVDHGKNDGCRDRKSVV